jgi:aryl-alcohol dehydrogenase-like predicted oxidoreductase
LGISLFDTAERYAAGESERIVGRWLESRPSSVTDDIGISTKVGPPWLDGRKGRFGHEYIHSIFGASLDRLGVDAVEVLYTHAPDSHPLRPDGYDTTPIEETLEGLEAIRSSGRVRRLGASNIDAQTLKTAIEAADRMGVDGYQVIQNGYNLLDPLADSEVRELAVSHGIAFTAYSALASGVLTGKYQRGQEPPPGSLVDIGYLDGVPGPVHDALDQLRAAADGRSSEPGVLALSWLMARSDVAAVTSAPSRKPPHLSLIGAAMDFDVTPEEAAEWSAWFESAATQIVESDS